MMSQKQKKETYYSSFLDCTERFTDLEMLYLVKLGFGCKGLVSSKISLLLWLPQKMTLTLKVVKRDTKLIISLSESKSVKHSLRSP